MFERIDKISEIEKFIKEKTKEIEPIRKKLSASHIELEQIKKEIVDEYVLKPHTYILDESVIVKYTEVKKFEIISEEFHANTQTETLLENNIGTKRSSYLSHSDIFELFIKTPEYQEILRNNKLKTILGDE